jgi:ubiquinone/menaquinone biosynthesis C-methylase UbiE
MSAITDKQVDPVQYHGELAEEWEQRYQKRSFQVRRDVLNECLQKEDLPGQYWLDAGCGTGTLSRALAERGCRVLGVDAAVAMLEKAKNLGKDKAVSALLQFEQVDNLVLLPFIDNSFDGVLCSSVLEYLADPDECLAEFARVLRPGGILIVSVPNRDSLTRQAQSACRTLGKRLGREWFEYLKISRNWYSLEDFRRKLAAHAMVEEKAVIFGGPFSRKIQSFPSWGSLIMFAARRN